MAPKILIVDDEPDLLDMVDLHLRRAGMDTLLARTGGEALRHAGESLPDLILLDIMLPDLPGTDLCRLLKHDPQTRDIPVIFLTARGEQADRIKGLELGADDYIVKSASMREMVLRVQAVLRRGARRPEETDQRRFGILEIDVPAHRVWVESREILLTALEFRLLTTLMDRKGRVQTRESLLEDVWSMSSRVTTRTVDTHVKRLREKLEAAGHYIETVRGVGYRFMDRPDE